MAGVLLESVGRSSEALPHLRFAVAHRPDDVGLRDVLACCLVNLGCAGEARTHLEQIVDAQPHNAKARFNLGRCLLDCRAFAEAERLYSDFVRDHPGDAEGYSHLGLARLARRDPDGAELCFRASLRMNPHDDLFHLNLARALAAQGRDAEARAAFTSAIRLAPKSAENRCIYGWFELERGRLSEAESHFVSASHQAPDIADAAAGRATVHIRRGVFAEARMLLDPLLTPVHVAPRVAMAHAELCLLEGKGHQALSTVRRALKGAIGRDEEAALRFSEGDILDGMREPDAAFDAYQRANQTQELFHSAASHRTLVDQLIAVFDEAFFARFPPRQSVFDGTCVLVGMPHSGIEQASQLLSTHPVVHNAGSLDDFPAMARGLARRVRGDEIYPNNMRELTNEVLAALEQTRRDGQGKWSSSAVVLDGTRHNFLHLGLIATVSPGTKVIHCVRDPIETCLSCYFQRFTVGRYGFAGDLNTLAGFFRDYQRLMEHWKRVLPIEMLEIQHSDLVEDVSQVHETLLGFVGLEWMPEIHGDAASVAQLRPSRLASDLSAAPYIHRLGPLRGLAAAV